MRFAVLK